MHVVARAHTHTVVATVVVVVVVVVVAVIALVVRYRCRSRANPSVAHFRRRRERISAASIGHVQSGLADSASRVLCAGMVLGGDSVVGELGAAATKLDPSNIGLFSALRPAMDLSTAAYRYNQNMMEYYTCE